MKRTLSLLLACALLAGLTACVRREDETRDPSGAPTQALSPSPTAADGPVSSSPTDGVAESPAGTDAPGLAAVQALYTDYILVQYKQLSASRDAEGKPLHAIDAPPDCLAVEDLTGDGVPELIAVGSGAGARQNVVLYQIRDNAVTFLAQSQVHTMDSLYRYTDAAQGEAWYYIYTCGPLEDSGKSYESCERITVDGLEPLYWSCRTYGQDESGYVYTPEYLLEGEYLLHGQHVSEAEADAFVVKLSTYGQVAAQNRSGLLSGCTPEEAAEIAAGLIEAFYSDMP